MNAKSTLAAFGLLLLSCSCTYKPYEHKEYENTASNDIKPHTAQKYLEAPDQLKDNMIGSVLIRPYMISICSESKCHGPYGLGLNLYCLRSNSIGITSIKVESSLSKTHLAANQKVFPIKINLKQGADGLWVGQCYLPRQMELDFDKGETVDITLEMTSNDNRQPVKETYKFVPVMRKGRFQLID